MTGQRTALLVVALAGVALAQIPSLGWCPDYVPMADFDMERYLGTWYEAERYFTVLEAGSRCVSTNYTKAVDGRVLVSNQITNRLTGIKRVVEGEIRNVVKGAESKLNVKYSTLPVPFETQYSVLDTDYDSYSVVWSCSSIGPLRTQNAWVMTRERLAPGTVLQMAYGILDKYKISRTFFVKTDQADCAIAEAMHEQRLQAEKQAAEAAAIAVKSASPLADPIAKPAPIPAAAPAPVPAPVPIPAAIPAAAPAALPVVPAEPVVVVPALPAIPAAVVADAPAAPAVPVAPFVPIPIAQQSIVALPVVPAVPEVAADPIPAPAPIIPAAPILTEIKKETAAEPAKVIAPTVAIAEPVKAVV